MRDIVGKIRGRLRHGLATQEILDMLARRGLALYPYIVFQECVEVQFSQKPGLETFHARQLTDDDAAQIATIPERPRREDEIRERFRRGDLGFAAFRQDTLVAYTWCDFERFGGLGRGSVLRKLENDEAYLYDAYTLPAYRGHGLVPFLRSEVYRVMEANGRRRLYSNSLFFNRSARRFKAKLGARELELRLSINLFQKIKHDLMLKRYSVDMPVRSA